MPASFIFCFVPFSVCPVILGERERVCAILRRERERDYIGLIKFSIPTCEERYSFFCLFIVSSFLLFFLSVKQAPAPCQIIQMQTVQQLHNGQRTLHC